MKVVDKKKLLTGDLVQEIENIVLRGNVAEIKKSQTGRVVVLETEKHLRAETTYEGLSDRG